MRYNKEATHRVCIKCNIEKVITDFYLCQSKKIGIYYHSYCKECNKKDKLQREKNNKIKSIEYKGGECQCCGYKKYYGSLEFHHKSPKEKDFNLSKKATCNIEILKPELDKCVLVCVNCHREIHAGLITHDKNGISVWANGFIKQYLPVMRDVLPS